MKTDFLIIGSGIAGLRAAIELGQYGKVLIVTKDRYFESSSSYAQGGIAVVTAEDDSTEYHVEDTLKAGAGLCREKAVRVLVGKGPHYVEQLIRWGASFDKDNGKYLLGLEGAHSRRRILHFKDSTGGEVVRVLREKVLENPRISKLPKHFAVDLLVREDRCVGAVLLNEASGEIYPVTAKATILATGGSGQIYSRTSNPPGATGDGIATAHRAGANLVDMEFVQFHPTTFALPGAPSFLITEALRGEGAALRNIKGHRFMRGYHPLGELAPRDELSRAIIREMKRSGGDYVFLDATKIKPSVLKERFPTAYTACLEYGIDITKDMIPVSPGAHFMIGGVETDTWGRTSLEGLFAAGEVACTGVHGANRLASNSLLEGLVFGARAGVAAVRSITDRRGFPTPPKADAERRSPLKVSRISRIREEIQEIMWNKAGIIRSSLSLEEALRDFSALAAGIEDHGYTRKELEIVNMLTTSSLIVSSALKRKESVGAHYREDFPQRTGSRRHIRIKLL